MRGNIFRLPLQFFFNNDIKSLKIQRIKLHMKYSFETCEITFISRRNIMSC